MHKQRKSPLHHSYDYKPECTFPIVGMHEWNIVLEIISIQNIDNVPGLQLSSLAAPGLGVPAPDLRDLLVLAGDLDFREAVFGCICLHDFCWCQAIPVTGCVY